jgi:hypothetical protein
MVLNNKGQMISIFFLMMIGVIMFILAFALAPPLKNSADSSRANMNCSNSSISTDKKVTCGVTDITTPFVVLVILGLAGAAFGAKLVVG